jgi:hypothetical protein
MNYKLVDGNQYGVHTFDDSNVIPEMAKRGYPHVGANDNNHNCTELQGQPIFKGLCGPMWDGDCVRYETPEMNDLLSR